MSKGSWREFDDPIQSSISTKTEPGTANGEQKVRLQRIKAGRGGKTVTLIKGLQLDEKGFRGLLKLLKSKLGTGGTINDDVLELQGDQITKLMQILNDQGYSPRQSGG